MSGMDLAKQYKENEAKIEQIRAERDNFAKAKDAEIYGLKYKIYRDKIRALEDECDSKVHEIEVAKEEHNAIADRQIEELRKVIKKVKRFIYLLKLQPDAKWEEEKVKAYRDRQLVRLGALYQDEFLDIRLYIVENDRPKNKYTLVAIGKCAFGEQVLEIPHSYGLDVDDWGTGANISWGYVSLPTIDDVKKYCIKHMGELMKNFLGKYREVKLECYEVIRTYKLEEFEGIE